MKQQKKIKLRGASLAFLLLLGIFLSQRMSAADQMLSNVNTWSNGTSGNIGSATWNAPYYTLQSSSGSSVNARLKTSVPFTIPGTGGYFVVMSVKNATSTNLPNQAGFKLRMGSAADGTQSMNDVTPATAYYQATNTSTSDIVYINSWTVGTQTYGNVYPAITFSWAAASTGNKIDFRAALWLDSNTGSIVTDQNQIVFNSTRYSTTFYVIGLNLSNANKELSNDISLSAPSGVALSTSTITANNAATTVTAVTVTWDKTTSLPAGSQINLTSGSVTKNISISAGQNIASSVSSVTASTTATGGSSVNYLKDGIVNYGSVSGGTPIAAAAATWETWTADGTRASFQWVEYDWATAQPVNQANVYFWCDQPDLTGKGIGVPRPDSWKVQYWDGAAWTDVTLLSGQSYTRNIASTNPVQFQDVTTTKIRMYLTPQNNGTYYGAVGATEFEVYRAITTSLSSLSFTSAGTKSFTVTGANLSSAISISAPAGITVDNALLSATSSGVTVNVTYDGVTPVSGNITLTSGNSMATVAVTGTASPVINASNPTSLSFTVSTPAPTFQVTAANLTADLTFTNVPVALTLSGANVVSNGDGTYKILQAKANNATNTITATWNKANNIASTNITIGSTGANSQSLAVSTGSDVESVAIRSIALSAGGLNTAFAVGTTSYAIIAPADITSVTVTGAQTPSVSTVTNNGKAVSNGNPVTLTGNSYNGVNHTSGYTFAWGGNYGFTDWSANRSIDAALSVPTVYGWSASPTLTWVAANSSTAGTCRLIDLTNGVNATAAGGITFTYGGSNFTGRILLLRWDGSGNAGRIFSYPMQLQAGTVYEITGKAAMHNGASTLTFGINLTKSITSPIVTGTVTTTTAGAFNDFSVANITVPTTGVYYLNITSSTAGLTDIADLVLNVQTTTTLIGDNTWSSATWSGGRMPLAIDNIAFSSGTLTIDANATANTITVAPDARLSLNAEKSLNVASLILQSDATGTATFVNNGSTNATSVNIQQYLTSGRNWYVSSPVSNTTTDALSTAAKVYRYNEPTAQFVEASGMLSPMTGYISQSTTTTGVITFSGILNDGDQTISLTRTPGVAKSGFNLVGNPYPSYVSWDAAEKTNLESTMWYRSKNAANSAYVFDTYNATGQVGTSNNGEPVNCNIPPMQAFWVRVSAGYSSGSLTFRNSMRTHKGSQTTTIGTVSDVNLKSATFDNLSQQVLRLKVSNGNVGDEAIVLFNPNASDGLDGYDSYKMSNGSASIPEIYTKVGLQNLVINGLTSLQGDREVSLGFTTGVSDTFSIQASQLVNLDGIKVFLRDNTLNVEQDLTNGESYTFTSDVTTTDSRFSILLKTSLIATRSQNAFIDNVHVYGKSNGRVLVISSNVFGEKDNAELFNCKGQRVTSRSLTQSSTVLADHLTPGVYMVVLHVNGEKRTDKVFVE